MLKKEVKTVDFQRKIWGMRKVSGKISIWKNGRSEITPRVALCGVRSNDGKNEGAYLVEGISKKHFISGTMKCGSVWRCPVCSYKISRQRQFEVVEVINHFKDLKREISFVTLTLRHTRKESLRASLNELMCEFRAMQRTSIYKPLRELYVGMIKALEFTYGKNGWHPHLHILYIHTSEVDEELRDFFGKNIIRQWVNRKKIRRRGTTMKAQDQRKVYNNDDIAEYIGKWDCAKEITSGMTKNGSDAKRKRIKGGITPFGMLADVYSRKKKLDEIKSLFGEYATATKGRAQLLISRGIVDEMKKTNPEWRVKTDEEIVKDEMIEKVVCRIERYLWYKLCVRNHVVGLLRAYERSKMIGVEQYLASKGYSVSNAFYSDINSENRGIYHSSLELDIYR